ncbi:MAG: hypothetical protein WBF31_06300 [Anaerolineae bacterium]
MKQIIVAFCLLLVLSACMEPRDGAAVTPAPPPTASPRPSVEEGTPPASPTPELWTPVPITPSAPATTSTPHLPIGCRSAIQDTLLHISRDADYCFHYPSRFSIHYPDNPENRTTYVDGPFLESGVPEPDQANMSISSSPIAAGQTLAQAVDAVIWWTIVPITDTRPIAPTLIASAPFTRTITTIGGEPAEIVEGLPGRLTTSQTFIIHDDRLYILMVSPSHLDLAYPKSQPDAKAVWETVIATFAFLK